MVAEGSARAGVQREQRSQADCRRSEQRATERADVIDQSSAANGAACDRNLECRDQQG
jgi:hypothetical protein